MEHMLEDDFGSIVGGRQLQEVDELSHLTEPVHHRHDALLSDGLRPVTKSRQMYGTLGDEEQAGIAGVQQEPGGMAGAGYRLGRRCHNPRCLYPV